MLPDCDIHALPASQREAGEDCAEAIRLLMEHRILADTGLEQGAHASLAERFAQACARQSFPGDAQTDPAYDFRPNSLPFPASPVLAAECYRTEQRIKELCLRVAARGCLDGRFGLVMAAEAETFTDRVTSYIDRAGAQVAPMDRDRLRQDVVRTIDREPCLGLRLRYGAMLEQVLPPKLAYEHGRVGFLRLLEKALQRIHAAW